MLESDCEASGPDGIGRGERGWTHLRAGLPAGERPLDARDAGGDEVDAVAKYAPRHIR
jgi:hypothetical protein